MIPKLFDLLKFILSIVSIFFYEQVNLSIFNNRIGPIL